MTWETFYATCFVAGLLLSVLSFLAGALHLHFPRGMHLHAGGIHAHGGGGTALRGGGRGVRGARGASFFNFGTITAFLAWFGGTGLLLTRHSSIWALLALALSTASGIAGASIVFWFMFKVLIADERDLDPADYSMIGVLGRVSSTVREGGVGEMIFSQEGVRRAASIRSESGKPIPRDTEVVVTQYKGGIAYVRPWEEMSEMDSAPQSERFGN